MNIKVLLILLGFGLLISACKDDEESGPIWGSLDNHVFITNEGNFQSSNGSVTAISRETGLIWQNIFESVNEFRLGDVVQSMSIHNDKAYIVVNNSGKIEVANAKTLESEGTISGLSSPRYFMGVDENKGYVTNLVFGGETTLDVIDLNTNQVIKTIPTGWAEQMVMANGKVYVGVIYTNQVLVIDTASDEVVDTVFVGMNPNSLRKDENNDIWVMCSDTYENFETPALYRINSSVSQVEASYTFPALTNLPQKLCINGAGDQLYYLDGNEVWNMSINDSSIPTTPFITTPAANTYIYALDVDPVTNYIYVGDALDFQQAGGVYRYESDGTPLDAFEVSIIPGNFCFN